jgi:exopolysaccharide biosynthesis protein
MHYKVNEKRVLTVMNGENFVTVGRPVRYKRKAKKLRMSKILCGTVLAMFIISSSGLILIRLGIFPGIQRMLVTSAMTTLSHKYIAYIIAEPDTINKIMADNSVEETQEVSNSSLVDVTQEGERGIKIEAISGEGYKGYMMIISDPSRISMAVPPSLGSYGQKIDKLVEENDAIAGINAGGFTDPEGMGNGGVPTGLVIKDGKVVFQQEGLSEFSLIGFNKDNILVIGKYTLQEIKKLNIRDGVSFKPFLIINGKPVKIYGDGGWGIAPRTVIGQKEDGTVLFLVIDGRQPLHSIGATIKDIQEIMIRYGAINAANLDGGSSTVMYNEGRIVNKPCSKGGDRYLPSAFIVK